MSLFKNTREKIIDMFQKQGGALTEKILRDLKIKSFHGIKIELEDLEITPPKIRIKSDGFKIKIIDSSTGKAISDIPIPIDVKVEIPPIKISFPKNITIDPKIDIKFAEEK